PPSHVADVCDRGRWTYWRGTSWRSRGNGETFTQTRLSIDPAQRCKSDSCRGRPQGVALVFAGTFLEGTGRIAAPRSRSENWHDGRRYPARRRDVPLWR